MMTTTIPPTTSSSQSPLHDLDLLAVTMGFPRGVFLFSLHLADTWCPLHSACNVREVSVNHAEEAIREPSCFPW